MKRLLFLFILLSLINIDNVSASAEWVIKSSMPTSRLELSCFVLNNKIYAIGGTDYQRRESNMKEKVEEYDPQRDTWTIKSPIPRPEKFLSRDKCICVANDKLYVFEANRVWEYTPQADVWKKKTSLPNSKILVAIGCVVIEYKIYLVMEIKRGLMKYEYCMGEYNLESDTWRVQSPVPKKLAVGQLGYQALMRINNKIYLIKERELGEYDVQENNWTVKKPLLKGFDTRYISSLPMVINDKIYIMISDGGIDVQETIPCEYTPQTDSWIRKTPMPTPRGNFGCIVLDDKIYTIGGYKETGILASSFCNVEVYDPKTDIWVKIAPLTGYRGRMGCAVVNGKIYAIGGVGIVVKNPNMKLSDLLLLKEATALATMNTVEEYTPLNRKPEGAKPGTATIFY